MNQLPFAAPPTPEADREEKRRRRRTLILILLILLMVPACLWVSSQLALLGLGMDSAHESLLSRLQATYAPWGSSSFNPLDPTLIGTIRAEQATLAAGGHGIGVLVPFIPGGPGQTQIAALPSATPTLPSPPTATQVSPATATNVVIILPATATTGPGVTSAPTSGWPATQVPTTPPPPPPPPPNTNTPSLADLSITNDDGVTTYTAPSVLTYTITVANASVLQVNNARVTDILPAGQFTVGSAGWTCLPSGAGSQCPASGTGNINTVSVRLGPLGSVTFTLIAPVSAGATGNLVTTATVTPPAAINDTNPANNSATDIDTPAGSTADLSITKTDNRLSILPDAALTYVITVDNAGPAAVTGATVTDTFAGVHAISWTCAAAGGATCTPGPALGDINDTVNMPAGSQLVYTVNATADAAPVTGNLVNTATVTAPAGVTDTNPANNSATDTDRIGKPDVLITLSWTSTDTFMDLDLWVYDPGALINVYQPVSPSGGTYSGDQNCTPALGLNAQETVSWPAPADIPPSGTYNVYAYSYDSCGAPFGTVDWTLTVTVDGVTVGTRTGTIVGQVVDPTAFVPVQSAYCPGTELFQGAPAVRARCNLPVPPPVQPPPPPSDDPRALGDPPTFTFTLP